MAFIIYEYQVPIVKGKPNPRSKHALARFPQVMTYLTVYNALLCVLGVFVHWPNISLHVAKDITVLYEGYSTGCVSNNNMYSSRIDALTDTDK